MNEQLVVGFDFDGILCTGTTIETELLLRQKKFIKKLEKISGDYSKEKALHETIGPLVRFFQAIEYARHNIRQADIEVLQKIKEFKELQARKKNITTKLVVVSGRSNRLTELTMGKIKEAGFEDLFDGYLLREPGYSSAGWKLHQSNVFPDANTYCQIDDDPLAGYSVLKTLVPHREKYAFIVQGRATNPQLLASAGVEPHSRLQMVGSVAQALSVIAGLK